MRMMLEVQLPVQKSNPTVRDGSLPKVIQGFIELFRPEASYFFPRSGRRSAVFFFDMKDPAQIPVVAERFFFDLETDLDLRPGMNAEDPQKGLGAALAQAGRARAAAPWRPL